MSGQDRAAAWWPGDVVTDVARRTSGVARAVTKDGRVLLVRPGGPAWTADATDLRTPTGAEALSMKVATANHRWGR
ncbi:hypothetical protein [Streptomyces axinellae]|uniref:Uncharacterized protein n=1 Tax=Streptomyces axinellae TaxID=552788 RepID=A0ABN3QXW1_9ACTN